MGPSPVELCPPGTWSAWFRRPAPGPAQAATADRPVLSSLGGVCMLSAVSTLLYLNHWNQAQESLRQERNLLLVERLRELGPANPTPLLPPRQPAPGRPGRQPRALQGSRPPPRHRRNPGSRSWTAAPATGGQAPPAAGSRQSQAGRPRRRPPPPPPPTTCQQGACSPAGGRGGRPWSGRFGHLPGGQQFLQRQRGRKHRLQWLAPAGHQWRRAVIERGGETRAVSIGNGE